MSALLEFAIQAEWITCSECCVSFAITSDHKVRLKRSRRTFYCPNGHSQFYPGETDAEKVRKEMQEKLDEANRLTEWQRSQRLTAEKAAAAAKKKLKAQTARINAGVCPHCHRTFRQLAAHMKSKHSEVIQCDH
jgi:uncharacterized Zn finger protein (UPF0148 family)